MFRGREKILLSNLVQELVRNLYRSLYLLDINYTVHYLKYRFFVFFCFILKDYILWASKTAKIQGSRQEGDSSARSILNAIAAATQFITRYLHRAVSDIVMDHRTEATA